MRDAALDLDPAPGPIPYSGSLTRWQRPDVEAPLIVWEYAASVERIADDRKRDLDALLDDALTLMDQHASPEVQMEARRRIIERHGTAKS